MHQVKWSSSIHVYNIYNSEMSSSLLLFTSQLDDSVEDDGPKLGSTAMDCAGTSGGLSLSFRDDSMRMERLLGSICQPVLPVQLGRRGKAPLQNVVAGYPMQIVAVDIVGPISPSTTGNAYIYWWLQTISRNGLRLTPFPTKRQLQWQRSWWMNFSVASLYPNNCILTKAANLSRESYRWSVVCSRSTKAARHPTTHNLTAL